ncbi:fatty acid-binding protein, muscle-like isoform X2 [Macrosteles quadrilineatus]|uniref:fatty acid-binding protein, muscle-like isoform X2 n=1 Tax=Macrosteles quadrilineatus TaxID=74068 RepID=UPI0023E0C696|nr:fatty acid-binding protein, muscle-like isoform X2 [Macrosteles quadrilineatus]
MASLIFNRKYKLATSDKFEEYMKALGVGLMTRKMGNTVSPVIELTENSGEYTLTSNSTFKNTAIKFRLGEEFEEETPDGRKVKSIITQDGNKLIHIQKGAKESKIIREFTNDEVKMLLTVDDITCTRVYKAVQ